MRHASLAPLVDRLTPHQQARRLAKIARRRDEGHVPPTPGAYPRLRVHCPHVTFADLRRRLFRRGQARPQVPTDLSEVTQRTNCKLATVFGALNRLTYLKLVRKEGRTYRLAAPAAPAPTTKSAGEVVWDGSKSSPSLQGGVRLA